MDMINKYSQLKRGLYLNILPFQYSFAVSLWHLHFWHSNTWRQWCHLSELSCFIFFKSHCNKSLRTVLLSSCTAFRTARTDTAVPRLPFHGYYQINLPDLGPQGVADHLFNIYSSAFIVFYDTRLKNNIVFQIVSDHHSLVLCLRSVIMVYTHCKLKFVIFGHF